MTWAFLFAAGTFLVQQLQGTDVAFSGLYFLYVLLCTLAFNIAGGFERIAGAYIFLFSVLVCIFGVTWKMVVNEAADTNLRAPVETMFCYACSAAALLVVAVCMKYIDLRKYEFGAGGRTKDLNFTSAGLGCVIVSLMINFSYVIFGTAQGGVMSILRQLDFFMPLGIMLATIGAIDDSHGLRTTNTASRIGIGITTLIGIMSFPSSR